MDNELLSMMQLLTKKSYITLQEIEFDANATRRQVMYRIEKINQLLKGEKVPDITTGMYQDVVIHPETKATIVQYIEQFNSISTYYLSKQERLAYMYFMLFVNQEYLSLQHFIDALKVSRSTVLLDLKELVQELESHHIHVKNTRSEGYYLKGSEMDIRRYMMRYVIYALAEERNTKFLDVFIDEFHLDIFDYSKLLISELAKKHRIRFVENRLVEFIYIFIFLKARMQNVKDQVIEINTITDISVMTTMKEYEFTIDLLKNYKNTENITQLDTNYISSWILGISFGDVLEDTKDCLVISELIGRIMTRFESLSGIHYKNSEAIFIQLYAHFRPAYYRLLFHLPIFNPLCEKVKKEYRELYQLVKETMKPFSTLFGEGIPKDEIAYLTLHFATLYSDSKEVEMMPQKTALIVCSNGIGSSAILYNELTSLFPELCFLPPLESTKVLDIDAKVDIIFTTNYISNILETEIPIIKVSPVMNIRERYQVVREVYLQLGSTFLKQPNVDIVMNIIRKYADVKEERSLYNELINYFSKIENMEGHEIKELRLKDLVSEKIIQLHVHVETWQEAIQTSYEPMIAERIVTQAYIDEIIRSVKVIGPYIVITKHVALPHAKPEDGALKCALGITVLQEAITFGSIENDPVKYIFSLSATDNETHITAISELVELLNRKEFFEMLEQAASPQDVLTYLSQ